MERLNRVINMRSKAKNDRRKSGLFPMIKTISRTNYSQFLTIFGLFLPSIIPAKLVLHDIWNFQRTCSKLKRVSCAKIRITMNNIYRVQSTLIEYSSSKEHFLVAIEKVPDLCVLAIFWQFLPPNLWKRVPVELKFSEKIHGTT